ncbi:MAG TPA: hypothetical protein VGR27_06540, partial [Longimicrobiaceae bacterium]|nr:hypothetical protein [Longimicrobiaceae bacterium]
PGCQRPREPAAAARAADGGVALPATHDAPKSATPRIPDAERARTSRVVQRMHHRNRVFRSQARLSLLLAALLYFAGAVAGPTLHSHVPADAGQVAFSVPEKHSGGIPAPDAERGCFVCHILGGVGLPAVSLPLPVSAERLTSGTPLQLVEVSFRAPAPSRARAPPPLHSA